MNAHIKSIEDMPILGILKPGDILVLELEQELSVEGYSRLKEAFKSAAADLGVKILLLPYGVRAVRIRTDDSDASLPRD